MDPLQLLLSAGLELLAQYRQYREQKRARGEDVSGLLTDAQIIDLLDGDVAALKARVAELRAAWSSEPV